MIEKILPLKRFRLHWLTDPHFEEIFGTDIDDAFRRAGYGAGAVRALDYYEEIKEIPK